MLDHFRDVESVVGLRNTERLKKIARKLPTDSRTYVAIVDQFVGGLGGDFELMFEEPLLRTTERLQDILRELYVLDFRTFQALLRQCDQALENQRNTGFGMNQTAILCHLAPPGHQGLSEEELLLRVESHLASPAMRHNARDIRRKLLLRSPKLSAAPDSYDCT
ncbi:MAG TPA: hypothetical protein VF593_14325 [Chthoniobacteraceae bacterium]